MESTLTESYPRLREEVVLRKHEQAGSVRYILKDPTTERFFQFGDLEGFIIERLDGKASQAEIRALVGRTFDIELDEKALDDFIRRLKNCNLVQDSISAATGPARPKRIQGDIFYLRMKLVDPDRFLGWLNANAGFFFSRTFVFLSLSSMVLALWIAVTEWGAITRSFSSLFTSISLAGAWAIVLLVVFAHEIAHGLACKRFGGRVNEMGFLLLYFMPAFYCNVSDAWLIPERSKRMLVTLAGAYSEVFLWSLSVIGWLLLEPHSFVHSAGLVVIATSGVKSMFNLNPLIKLDGYYLLSDYLDIHNLRWRAFSYLGNRIRAMWTKGLLPPEGVTPRERKIFVVFGLLSFFYTFWIISFFAWDFGVYLISEYHAIGLGVFILFLAGILRNPLKKLFQKRSVAVQPNHARNPNRLSTRSRVLLTLTIIVAMLFVIPADMKVSGDFVILPEHNADIQTQVDGFVSSVFVREGERVHQGDPIVSLANRELVSALEQKKAEADAALATLRLVIAGPKPEEIALARAQYEKSQELVKYAQKELERTSTLFERNLVAKTELERAQESVAVRQKEVEESKSRLGALAAGFRPQEIAARRADVDRLRAELRFLDEQINELTIRSPIDGIMTTHMLEAKIGQNIKKGELVAEVHNMETVTAELRVPEKEIPGIRIGQRVELKARAFPYENFSGVVRSVAPIASVPENWYGGPVVLVQVQLDSSGRMLRSGMTGIAKVYTGEGKLIDGVTRKVMHFIRVDVWSWW